MDAENGDNLGDELFTYGDGGRVIWEGHRGSGDSERTGAYAMNANQRRNTLLDVFLRTWYLGFTSFGGPTVHFQIFHRNFVEGKDPWIDEQTYQELFAICQALPGPASTEMGFCITLLRGGVIAAVMEFLTWSLPGAMAMYALAIGVSKVSTTLPLPVYALLSGLNASVVGVVAFSAVQLAFRAITDKLSRMIVVASACAGLCYNALWYFPVLVILGGCLTLVWDIWARNAVKRSVLRRRTRRRRGGGNSPSAVLAVEPTSAPAEDLSGIELEQREVDDAKNTVGPRSRASSVRPAGDETSSAETRVQVAMPADRTIPRSIRRAHAISVPVGIVVIVAFFVSFITIMVVNGVLKNPPLELKLFRNMYLAGLIIFGGGPVVIPLLREYTVQTGWLSARDFLIGLAIIQAMPGPNFNFAVYLGALTLTSTRIHALAGALLGYIGLFAPGLLLAIGFQSIWHNLRSRPTVVAVLRGVNAAAVGLVFTAVYRLWEIGYLIPEAQAGVSLGRDPWWVVVATLAYTGTAWFGVETWVAILAGSVLGLCWYAAVKL